MVKDVIKRVTCQYAIIDNDENYLDNCSDEELQNFQASHSPESLQSLPLKINSELFLESLLMEIRRVTIIFSAIKKTKSPGRRAFAFI